MKETDYMKESENPNHLDTEKVGAVELMKKNRLVYDIDESEIS